jgi:hypothetical protein
VTGINFPDALLPLRAGTRWVVWQYELDKTGRRTKVLYVAHGRKASSTNPRTWRNFDALPLGNGFDGPGLVLGDGLQGVDLDACIDGEGALEPWAAEIVARLDTYTEVSPSGRGLKAFFYGPPGASSEVAFGEAVELAPGQFKRRELALFTAGRYFTVTGRAWGESKALATIDEPTAIWLRERIETLREKERERKAPTKPKAPRKQREPRQAPRGDDNQPAHTDDTLPATRLPDKLLDLIRIGVDEGKRSEEFHRAVRWCADCGMTGQQISDLLRQYPAGIASKYAGRVAREVERSLRGHEQAAEVLPPAYSEDDLALDFAANYGAWLRWSHGMGWMLDGGTLWRKDHELRRFPERCRKPHRPTQGARDQGDAGCARRGAEAMSDDADRPHW